MLYMGKGKQYWEALEDLLDGIQPNINNRYIKLKGLGAVFIFCWLHNMHWKSRRLASTPYVCGFSQIILQ